MSIKDNTFIIYGKDNCPHCVRAKEFAKSKGLEFLYLTLDKNYTKE
ncbi:TPA: glutaredoxin, partial [Enterobacter asburiae]|nr:glutaredoxin [Enterobacter asburiae]